MRRIAMFLCLSFSAGAGFAASPAHAQSGGSLPAAAALQVDFARDVRPLLQTHCFSCHGRAQQQAGLRLDVRQQALRGGDSGPVIVPGRSAESKLILRMTGSSAGLQMPPTGALSGEEIGVLRAWIDQGAEFADAAPEAPAPSGSRRADPKAAALFDALRRGDGAAVRKLLGGDPALAVARDETGATPLLYAALYGDAPLVRLLLERGADPNAATASGATALVWCAPDARKARLLVEAGANVNAKSQDGRTPLLVAARVAGSSDAVTLLLDRGAAVAARDAAGVTALMQAGASGDSALVRLLLSRGAEVNARAGSGATALMTAVGARCLGCVDDLLGHGADPRIATKRGVTPLGLAAMYGSAPLVTALLARGADPNAADVEGYTPLMRAAHSDVQNVEILRALVAAGADLSRRAGGETALAMARRHGDGAVVSALLEAGAKE